VYYYATINPRTHDNMSGDRHLQSSQHDVQVHPLSTVSKTHPYRLCEYDTATGEYACILYREDALNFIHSYNVRGPGTQEDFILWLVDSGTTSSLSNLIRHMFIQIPCHTKINGVGQAVCDTCAALILHCISEDDLTYISIHGEHVYYMSHMKFPILSTGKLTCRTDPGKDHNSYEAKSGSRL
jgi:hypothetical protein